MKHYEAVRNKDGHWASVPSILSWKWMLGELRTMKEKDKKNQTKIEKLKIRVKN
ncbi:hypothetical protein [Nisaea sp.]|uniref:hypothetical protein n=1 Tax=Nisaea sp. TaxID=2024842 RepID=UPI003297CF1A